MANITVDWEPQPRQETFLESCGLAHPFTQQNPSPAEADVIGYGGAAGGGKSDAMLLIGIIAGLTYPGAKVGYFRRTYSQLEGPGGAIMRSHELMNEWAKWNGTKRRWTLPTSSILEFCYCDNEKDVHNYQSSQFDIICFDEGTQFTKFQYRYMITRNRATVDYDSFNPFMAIGTNPGGPGHQWFKKQFVDIGPEEEVHEIEINGETEKHIFIPAHLSDNEILQERDPNYRSKLASQGEVIAKQLLEGDWDSFEGQYFTEWTRNIHTVKPFEIPSYWKKFRSLDYGLDCTACYWHAVDPQGKIYTYRELWQPDLNLREAAERIIELTPPTEREEITYTVASPDLWNRRQDTGLSGVEIMYKKQREMKRGNLNLTKADNRRVPGWRAMKTYIEVFEDDSQGQENSYLTANWVVFNDNKKLIESMPALLHDENNANDVADEPHWATHAPESCRYMVMSRPPAESLTEEQKREKKRRRKKRVSPRSDVTNY